MISLLLTIWHLQITELIKGLKTNICTTLILVCTLKYSQRYQHLQFLKVHPLIHTQNMCFSKQKTALDQWYGRMVQYLRKMGSSRSSSIFFRFEQWYIIRETIGEVHSCKGRHLKVFPSFPSYKNSTHNIFKNFL